MPDLLPQTLKQIEMYRAMFRINARPRFQYQNLPDSERLRYELVSWDNFWVFLDLFADDPHPFVDKRFKNRVELEEYVVDLLEYAHYSPKHGGCDWLVKLRDKDACVGVLHVYDLNHEIYEGFHPPCYFGYAIAAPYRRLGYAQEAAGHLLRQIPLLFERFEVLAGCKSDNLASIALLEKLGFRREEAPSGRETDFWYKKLIEGEIPKAKP